MRGDRFKLMRTSAESAGMDSHLHADIDVCICSFRRPQIVETLAAIAAQRSPLGARIRVIVADNTHGGDASRLVHLAADDLGLQLKYVHAPANNISIARNACLDAATAPWVAFIDDDETPCSVWLALLLEEAVHGKWDAVLGPVIAVHPHDSPAWLNEGRFHCTEPVRSKGTIATGYTGNVLFRRAFVKGAGLRFRIELGNSGGEDEDFFYRLRDAGGTIGYAPNAACYERVPHSRAKLKWLIRRSFRCGQSHGTRIRARGYRPLAASIAVFKALVCGAGAAAHLASPAARNRCLTRAALHCGVVAKLAGVQDIQMY